MLSNLWLIGLDMSNTNDNNDELLQDEDDDNMKKAWYYHHYLGEGGFTHYNNICTAFVITINDSKNSAMDYKYYSNVGKWWVMGGVRVVVL